MDVQEPIRVLANEAGRKDSHVLRQHDIVRLIRGKDFPHLLFVHLPRNTVMRDVVKRDVETISQGSQGLVVTDDSADAGRQLAILVAQKQVAEAVGFLRHHDDDRPVAGNGQADRGGRGQDLPEVLDGRLRGRFALERRSHEEVARRRVDELLVRCDVEAGVE